MRTIARCMLRLACAAGVSWPGASHGEGHYAYVADGEVYLTNVPDDSRYRPVDAVEQRLAGRSPILAAQPPYAAVVAAAAARHGLDPALLHAVIAVESGYNARAVSHRGAAGLMQLMPATARRFGVRDVFNPAENVHAGARHLVQLMRLFGSDLTLALAAYNAGEAAVMRHGYRIPPFPETEAYVPRVVRLYRALREAM